MAVITIMVINENETREKYSRERWACASCAIWKGGFRSERWTRAAADLIEKRERKIRNNLLVA